MRFVVSITKKYQHQGLPLSDLISEGNIGLIKAAEKFDETRGFKFISFAVWWIRQTILSAIAEHTRMIRLPRNHINLITKMNKAAAELENRLERPPTDEDIAEHLEVEPNKIGDARYYAGRTASYDTPLTLEPDFLLIELLGNGEKNIEDHLLSESQTQLISRLLDTLTPRERQVIELAFGFHSDWPLALPDIGEVLGLGGERVRQLKKEALEKLTQQAAGLTGLLA